jgi:hypothetical protein
MYGWNTYRVTLDALIAFAWSAPMRELAERTGLSDTGLKKLLRSHALISPPQGHWNRVHAGRPVQQPPSAPARGPGERTYVLLYESPFEKRRLRILKAVFLTLGRRGHRASAGRDGHQTDFGITIGDTHVALSLDEAVRKPIACNRYNTPPPDPRRSAAVKLRLTAGDAVWQDDGVGTLETRIADIAAGLIVEGERAYRLDLREMEEQAERVRILAEQQRQERLRKANADRVAALIESGRLVAEADDLRSLIARVGAAVVEGRLDLSPQQYAEWRAWADGEADKLDPVLSGQVAAHLLPPAEV